VKSTKYEAFYHVTFFKPTNCTGTYYIFYHLLLFSFF